MSVKGIDKRNKPSHKDMLNATMDMLIGKIPEKKKRKKRAKETEKRNMREKKLEKEIILALLSKGYKVYKTGGAGAYDYNTRYNVEGITDLIVLAKLRVVFMEIKTEDKRNVKNGGLTGKQPEFRAICEGFGLNYCIVYNKEEAIKEMEESW